MQSVLPGTILFDYAEEGSSTFFRNVGVIARATVIFVKKWLQKPQILLIEMYFK
jgi:hypothetical protein